MSILENLSDLAHEIRSGAGTVLRTIGSHLEATERARVDASAVCAGCGHARVDHVELVGRCYKRIGLERVPCTCRRFLGSVGAQWLTEFEEQRDSLDNEFDKMRRDIGPESPKWLRDVIDATEAYCAGIAEARCVAAAAYCVCALPLGHTGDHQCMYCGEWPTQAAGAPVVRSNDPWATEASAAVSAAADPSPTVPNAHSVVGDCPGSDSVILPTVEPGQPNRITCKECGELRVDNDPCTTCMLGCYSDERVFKHLNAARSFIFKQTPPNKLMAIEKLFHAVLALAQDEPLPVPPVVAGESPRGVSTDQPSLGEPVTHEDLAAHLTGAAIRANTGHPDVLIEAFASSLLTDFNITPK